MLALKTREGSREEFFGRASLGATGLYATLEGPIGAAKKTSWLVSARKSYLDYVLERLDDERHRPRLLRRDREADPPSEPAQTLSLGLLHGRSRWRSTEADLRPQDAHTADAGTDLATLQWRWLPSPRSWLESVAFFSRETGRNRNVDGTDRFRSASRSGACARTRRASSGVTAWRPASCSAACPRTRSRASSTAARVLPRDGELRRAERPGRRLPAGHLDGARRPADRSPLGGRLDRFEETRETRCCPRASLAWASPGSTKLLAAFGEYAQFPAFEQLFGRHGNPDLRAERATHSLFGIEHSLGSEHAGARGSLRAAS